MEDADEIKKNADRMSSMVNCLKKLCVQTEGENDRKEEEKVSDASSSADLLNSLDVDVEEIHNIHNESMMYLKKKSPPGF